MRNVLLTFFATCTCFLSLTLYGVAKGSIAVNPEYVTADNQDALTSYLAANQ